VLSVLEDAVECFMKHLDAGDKFRRQRKGNRGTRLYAMLQEKEDELRAGIHSSPSIFS
jgi:hypothetical protein